MSPKLISHAYRFFITLMIFISLFATYLIVVLISFNPSDPSWSQTAWNENIHNFGGRVGAWLADMLLFIFGITAYAISPMILGLFWITFQTYIYQDYINYFVFSLRLIGILMLIASSCCLAELNVDDIWYFPSGGIIGNLIDNITEPYLNSAKKTLVLLFCWATGLTLYTGYSWLAIAERIGACVMFLIIFFSNSVCIRMECDEKKIK